MIITTTPSVEGKRITAYRGIVTGEAILGANLFKDLFAGIRDLVGGRSATYERELQRARRLPSRNSNSEPWSSEPQPLWASISTTRCSARPTGC